MEQDVAKEIINIEHLPVCEDVPRYLALLRGLKEYHQIVDERLKNAKAKQEEIEFLGQRIEPVTEKEVKVVFEESGEFKALFWDFYDRVVHLSYDPKKYSQKFQDAFEDYRKKAIQSVVAAEMGGPGSKDKNLIRSETHDNAAKILVEDGVVETEKLGRILVRAFLVDVRYDYIFSARQADQLRVISELADRNNQKAIVDFLVRIPPIGKEYFSLLRIKEIRDSFVTENPGAKKVERENYREKPNFYLLFRDE